MKMVALKLDRLYLASVHRLNVARGHKRLEGYYTTLNEL